MKRVLILAAFVFVSACSHQTPSEFKSSSARAPSSEKNQNTFESLVESENPRQAARAYVARLLKIRVRAHSWIAEQDREIRQMRGHSFDIFELPLYRKLLVTRSMVESAEHKIADIYAEAVAQARENDRAREVAEGFREALVQAWHNKPMRVLLHDLVTTMREAAGDNGLPFQASSTGMGAPQAQVPVKPLGAFQLAKTAIEAAPALDQMASQLPETDDFTDEVDEAVRNTDFERKDEGRSPQAFAVYPSAAANGNIDGKTFPVGTFALTFDDGPNPKHTMKIVAELQKAGVKGTFFWIASNVKEYPSVVKAVQGAGMPVENHSWNHAKLTDPADLARFRSSLQHEIVESTDLETKIFGVTPKFFRTPYGAGTYDAKIRAMIAKKDMIHVRWNVDSVDWGDKNPVTVLARVLEQMKGVKRGIILFHDRQPHTAGVVKTLLAQVKSKYRWVTIPEIVDELNGLR